MRREVTVGGKLAGLRRTGGEGRRKGLEGEVAGRDMHPGQGRHPQVMRMQGHLSHETARWQAFFGVWKGEGPESTLCVFS